MHQTKQVYYNQVKGEISEINNTNDFPSVVLTVGHDSKRNVNICFKKNLLNNFISKHKVGDSVAIKFFVSSRFKHGRWYTMVNALEFGE